MTKAMRIFEDTRRECQKHIKNWGYNPETDGGFNGLITDEVTYKRTTNEIEIILAKREKELDLMGKYDAMTADKIEIERLTLMMVRKTLANQIRNNAEWQ